MMRAADSSAEADAAGKSVQYCTAMQQCCLLHRPRTHTVLVKSSWLTTVTSLSFFCLLSLLYVCSAAALKKISVAAPVIAPLIGKQIAPVSTVTINRTDTAYRNSNCPIPAIPLILSCLICSYCLLSHTHSHLILTLSHTHTHTHLHSATYVGSIQDCYSSNTKCVSLEGSRSTFTSTPHRP